MYETKNKAMDRYTITFEGFNKLASAYQDKFMNLDLYNDTYDKFCQLLNKANAKVLDIGCGPGNVTKYLLAKLPDLKIDGIDMAPNMVELAKANNPTASFEIMDCRKIDKLPGKYDGIICGFCMPYLSKTDCAKLIKDCSQLLRIGGILYFSAIEGDYSESGFETASNGQAKAYVYYHQQDYLQHQLTLYNFRLIHLDRKQYQKSADTISTHMIFISEKK